ncbi:MAG TPA: TonB-dependent receptor, partial [Blastocatellia bacterium]|nr:TonB-dependent receptor [Blastocatellia bacterium]
FTILTNQFTAEHGHSSAGQFNTITKTGTNEVHGDLWYYNQNKFLNALDHRLKEQAAAEGRFGDDFERPRFDFNRVGGDVGGPIIKDKLFYFGAFQYQTQGTAGTTQNFTVPTAEGFARLAGLGGISQFNLNILRTHVPPAPSASGTTTVRGVEIPTGELVVQVPDFFTLYQWHTNIDYNLSDSDQLRGRFFWDRFRSPLTGSPGPEFTGSVNVDNRLFSLTEIHNFSSTLINEFRFGYRRQVAAFDVPLDFPTFPQGEFPNISFFDTGLVIGPDGNSPQSGITNVYQGADNVSWTTGRHQLKFGVDYRNAIAPTIFLPRQRGDYIYEDLEEFLLDVKPGFAIRGIGSGSFAGNQQAIYLFAQDDFKWRPNFTLNLGVRYEYTGNARDAKLQEFNAVSNVDANDPALVRLRQMPGFEGFFPNGIIFREPETDKNNIAPRIGFAWAPDFKEGWLHTIFGEQGQSSLRGGFGIAYDVLFQNLVLLQLPPQFQQEIDASSGSGGPFGNDTRFLESGGIPPPVGGVPQEFFTDRDLARAFTQGIILDTQTPYTISWSLAYQREFLKNWSVETRYLGTRGVHLFVQNRLNGGIVPDISLPIFLSPSEIPSQSVRNGMPSRQDFRDARRRPLAELGFLSNFTAFPAAGNSTYHGGSINVKRRLAGGFTLDASYTFSNTIDDSTNELFSSFVNPRRPQDFFDLRNERGPSVLHRPHRFVVGFIYELPFYRNERGLLGQVLGNWQLSGIYQIESGQPINALSFRDVNGNFDNAGDRTFVNINGDRRRGTDIDFVLRNGRIARRGIDPTPDNSQVIGYIVRDPNAFWIRGDEGASLPTAGRNVLRAEKINNLDLTIFKRFPITENHRLEFRVEMFNALNHPQFFVDDPFATDYITPDDSPGSRFLDPTLFAGKPRVIQLVLRYSF